jgi:hypothetical protein
MLSKQEEEQERRAVLENDRKVLEQRGGTFFQHGVSQAAELSQGRFAAVGAPTVVGSKPNPSTQYPAASAAHQTELPPEQPLGFSIDDMPGLENPTGDASSGLSPPVATGPASADAPSRLDLPLGDAQRAGAGPLSSERDDG